MASRRQLGCRDPCSEVALSLSQTRPFVNDQSDGMGWIFVVFEDPVSLGDVLFKEVRFGDKVKMLSFVIDKRFSVP